MDGAAGLRGVHRGGIAFALLLDRLDHLGTRAAGLACALRGTLATLRAVPVLMLMFWAYFLIPMALGVAVPETTTVVTALAAVGAAYIAQSMQAGLLAVGTGQRNAALALGMSPGQALLTVVLPQAWRIMLPSVANQWVSTVKDTSLAYIVGVVELSTAASQVNSRMSPIRRRSSRPWQGCISCCAAGSNCCRDGCGPVRRPDRPRPRGCGPGEALCAGGHGRWRIPVPSRSRFVRGHSP